MVVDVVLVRSAELVAHNLMPYVLSMPRRCLCGEQWIISLSEPLALEVEMGSVGSTHLALLRDTMLSKCSNHEVYNHLRTDGETVWCVAA
jgi:hypothetical protein